MQWYLESRQLAASGSLVLLLGYDYSYCWVDWWLFDGVGVEYSRLLERWDRQALMGFEKSFVYSKRLCLYCT